jgi:hypothetical protein
MAVLTVLGTVIGGLGLWAAWFFYNKSTKDLDEKARELRDLLAALHRQTAQMTALHTELHQQTAEMKTYFVKIRGGVRTLARALQQGDPRIDINYDADGDPTGMNYKLVVDPAVYLFSGGSVSLHKTPASQDKIGDKAVPTGGPSGAEKTPESLQESGG